MYCLGTSRQSQLDAQVMHGYVSSLLGGGERGKTLPETASGADAAGTWIHAFLRFQEQWLVKRAMHPTLA